MTSNYYDSALVQASRTLWLYISLDGEVHAWGGPFSRLTTRCKKSYAIRGELAKTTSVTCQACGHART